MHQLEIKYFYPLTEQISLDLDYNASEDYIKNKTVSCLSLGTGLVRGSTLISGNTTLGWSTGITATEINLRSSKNECFIEPFDGLKVGYNKKPNFLRRVIMKVLLGWKFTNA